jgi:hypothetical protein
MVNVALSVSFVPHPHLLPSVVLGVGFRVHITLHCDTTTHIHTPCIMIHYGILMPYYLGIPAVTTTVDPHPPLSEGHKSKPPS